MTGKVILPYSASASTIPSAGEIVTTARGLLTTAAQLTAPYILSGTFTPQTGFEHFNIALRSDLNPSGANTSADRTGIIVTFIVDGPGISIQQFTATGWAQLATTNFGLVSGRSHSFAITDTGSKITAHRSQLAFITSGLSELKGHPDSYSSLGSIRAEPRARGFDVTSILPKSQNFWFTGRKLPHRFVLRQISCQRSVRGQKGSEPDLRDG